MYRFKRLLATVIPVVLAAMLALAAATAARAAVIVNEHDELINTDVSPCGANPEVIDFQGKVHHVFRVTETSSGALHVADEVNLQAQGVGETTGAKYVARDQFTTGFNTMPGAAATQQYVETFRVIRQGSSVPDDDLLLTSVFHVTINANGDVTASVDKFEGGCK